MSSLSKPAPRTPLHLEVAFKRNYARLSDNGVLKNISLTGAFLEVSNPNLRLDEKINLTFVVGDRERKIAAQVIWKNSLGSGIKFIPSNQRDVQIIDDLIYYVESKRMGYRSVLDGILKNVS